MAEHMLPLQHALATPPGRRKVGRHAVVKKELIRYSEERGLEQKHAQQIYSAGAAYVSQGCAGGTL